MKHFAINSYQQLIFIIVKKPQFSFKVCPFNIDLSAYQGQYPSDNVPDPSHFELTPLFQFCLLPGILKPQRKV